MSFIFLSKVPDLHSERLWFCGSSHWDSTNEIHTACRATPPLRNVGLLNPFLPSLPRSLCLTWPVIRLWFCSRGLRCVCARFHCFQTHSRWFHWRTRAPWTRADHWDQLLGWNENKHTQGWPWLMWGRHMCVMLNLGNVIPYFRKK